MKRMFLFFAVLTFSIITASFADDQADQVITLKDGSQIKGQLSGIGNGVYTIKTPAIGDVHVSVGDVVSINNSNTPASVLSMSPMSSAPGQASGNLDQQITANQQKLMSNPQSMETLQEMIQDPEIMQLLQDPSLMQAALSHDYAAVQNNPKMKELMNNPKMQALLQKLSAQIQQPNSSSQQ